MSVPALAWRSCAATGGTWALLSVDALISPDPRPGSARRSAVGRRLVVHRVDMLAYMQRTTVKLSDDLDARLRHEAARRGMTVSQVTREAIEEHLGAGRSRRRLLAAAAGSSGRCDISERIEEILMEEGLASH